MTLPEDLVPESERAAVSVIGMYQKRVYLVNPFMPSIYEWDINSVGLNGMPQSMYIVIYFVLWFTVFSKINLHRGIKIWGISLVFT